MDSFWLRVYIIYYPWTNQIQFYLVISLHRYLPFKMSLLTIIDHFIFEQIKNRSRDFIPCSRPWEININAAILYVIIFVQFVSCYFYLVPNLDIVLWGIVNRIWPFLEHCSSNRLKLFNYFQYLFKFITSIENIKFVVICDSWFLFKFLPFIKALLRPQ